ncbi:MAG: energy transducer TonB [Paludibacteraceae bacterium]|nr:energy transducer TonB [Paludibacteraceae bacterium]
MKKLNLKFILLSLFITWTMGLFAADETAKFPGGNEELAKYLQSNVSYPEQALKNNEFGQVFVSFMVDVDGSIKDVKVVKGVSSSLDAEALRVVASMPKWTPAKTDGKAVKSSFSLPIVFHLPGNVLGK